MFSSFRKSKSVKSSSLSDFVYYANSSEKRRVYKKVIERAILSQENVVNKALALKDGELKAPL